MKAMKACYLALLLLFAPLAAVAQERDPDALYAVIDTSRGVMEFELYKAVAPLTVANFVNLATRGYYDGLSFHRVVENFMAQGGDPKGDGSGGPGYRFADEIALRLNDAGLLAMANAGPNTNGSQFFITHQAAPHLNGAHTVFGKIVSGRELIWEIRQGDTINSISIEGNAKRFLERHDDQIYLWNQILNENFPRLREPLVD